MLKGSGFDFSGVIAPENSETPYSIRYSEFVVSLVKAVQEQQEVISERKNIIDALIERVEALEKSKK